MGTKPYYDCNDLTNTKLIFNKRSIKQDEQLTIAHNEITKNKEITKNIVPVGTKTIEKESLKI